ncbi:MAG: hypothetical protein GY720_01070 [bacterium]|nr:hypothetical protein [bacterium]
MDEGNTNDPFDDLFEAFELEDGPPPVSKDQPSETPEAVEEPVAAAHLEPDEAPTATVVCTSCGAGNPAHNRHCEQCGARLGTGALPVAPAPMIRATPGGRAITVIGGALLIVLVAVLLLNLGGDDDPSETSAAPSSTSTTAIGVIELKPFSVDASSSFPGFEESNLIDGQDSTYWNDNSLRGNNAWLEFEFAQEVQITEIELQNLQDEEKFRRNYRIKSIVITVDDLQIEIPDQLEDNTDPRRIQIGSLATTRVRIEINSTYPAEQFNGGVPFDELALQEVIFFGNVAP